MALVSGAVFAVLQIVLIIYVATTILPLLGELDAPLAERAAALAENAAAVRLSNFLSVLPSLFLLFFLGGLYSILRRAEGESSVLAMTAAGSGFALAMLWPLGVVIHDINIEVAVHGGDPAVIFALEAIAPFTLALSAVPRTVLMVASSLALLSYRLTARWIGITGLVVAFLSLAGSATLVAPEVFGLLGISTILFELWLIIFCVALLRRESGAGDQAGVVAAA